MRSSSIAGLLNEHDYQLQAEELKIWIDNLLTSKLKSNLRGCFSLKPQYCQTSPYIMIPGVLLTEFEMYNYRFTSWCSLPTAQQLWLTASFISSVLKRFSSFFYLLSLVQGEKISSRRVKSKGKKHTDAPKSDGRLRDLRSSWISEQLHTHFTMIRLLTNSWASPYHTLTTFSKKGPHSTKPGAAQQVPAGSQWPWQPLALLPNRPWLQLITHWTWINRHLEPWQSLSLLTGEASVHWAPLHPWLPWMFFQ